MKTILVVDDDPASADVLNFVLNHEGYAVVCASNGRHALERALELHPDLVVLDHLMPAMDGAAVGRVMRRTRELAHVPIVLNSSLPEETVRPLFDGYDAFFRKPYSIDALLARVRGLLGGARTPQGTDGAESPSA